MMAQRTSVLILVLVEHTLRGEKPFTLGVVMYVLILVLVEHTLRVHQGGV